MAMLGLHRSGLGRDRGGPGFGVLTALRILARVFGFGFLVGGALGVRTGVRAARRHRTPTGCKDPGHEDSKHRCITVSGDDVRRRLHRATEALFGPVPAPGPDAAGVGSTLEGEAHTPGTSLPGTHPDPVA